MKPKMTKRVKNQYDRILIGDGHERMFHYTWGQPLKYGLDFFTVGQKNARFAYLFYEQYGGYDGVNFNRIQNIIIRSGHAHTIYLWAKNIPNANVRKCQYAIMRIGSSKLLRLFGLNVIGSDLDSLESLSIIKDVFDM